MYKLTNKLLLFFTLSLRHNVLYTSLDFGKSLLFIEKKTMTFYATTNSHEADFKSVV